MNDYGHTPGPWIARPPLERENCPIVEVRHSGYKQLVALVYGLHPGERHPGGPEFEGTREANARLIAAAPELVKVIETLLAAYDRKAIIPPDAYPRMWEAARAVLASLVGPQDAEEVKP